MVSWLFAMIAWKTNDRGSENNDRAKRCLLGRGVAGDGEVAQGYRIGGSCGHLGLEGNCDPGRKGIVGIEDSRGDRDGSSPALCGHLTDGGAGGAGRVARNKRFRHACGASDKNRIAPFDGESKRRQDAFVRIIEIDFYAVAGLNGSGRNDAGS